MKEIYRDFIAGVQHAKPNFLLLTRDDPLTLVWERDNKYDPAAIRVDHPQAGKLGYIKRIHNRDIHAVLAAGVKISASLTYINPDADPWERLVVAVKMISDDVGAMSPSEENKTNQNQNQTNEQN